MTLYKVVSISIAACMVVAVATTTAFAERSRGSSSEQENNTSVKVTTDGTSHSSHVEVETETHTVSATGDDIKVEIEKKQLEVRAKVEAKQAEIKEKLTSDRLKLCEKREATINRIIENANKRSQDQLDVFQKIEDRVKTYYVDNKLQVANYDELVQAADNAKAAATAQVNVSSQTNFQCSEASNDNPGSVIRDVMHSKNEALGNYRTAIKNLIVAIKSAAASERNG